MDLTILDSAILVFPLKLTHTCQDWFPPFAQKNFTHSLVPTNCTKIFIHWFWLKLIMAAILNSAMLDSETLFSSLRFTQKHSPPTLILTQTNSFWLKLIHSHSIWWWQPSWILPYWIQTLPSWIQTPCYLLSYSLKNTLPPLWFWLKLIQSDWNPIIITKLNDGSHLEFGHLGFSHFRISSQTHSHLPRLVPTICTKTLHSHFPSHHLHKRNLTHSLVPTICTKKLHSLILTHFHDGRHLEFCHVGFSHCHLGFRHLVIFSLFHSKHSHSTLTLTQINLIWLKLIHS